MCCNNIIEKCFDKKYCPDFNYFVSFYCSKHCKNNFELFVKDKYIIKCL